MRVFVLSNGTYVTVEKDYKDVGYDLSSNGTRSHSGVKDLARYWTNRKLQLNELEIGLIDALRLNNNVLEYGDFKGTYLYSLKQ